MCVWGLEVIDGLDPVVSGDSDLAITGLLVDLGRGWRSGNIGASITFAFVYASCILLKNKTHVDFVLGAKYFGVGVDVGPAEVLDNFRPGHDELRALSVILQWREVNIKLATPYQIQNPAEDEVVGDHAVALAFFLHPQCEGDE